MKLREFAYVKRRMDSSKTMKDWPTGRMADLATEIMFDEGYERSEHLKAQQREKRSDE
jgi:hypothetical protein